MTLPFHASVTLKTSAVSHRKRKCLPLNGKADMSAHGTLNYQQRLKSSFILMRLFFFSFFEEWIVKYLPNFGTYMGPFFSSFQCLVLHLCHKSSSHVSGWNPVTSSLSAGSGCLLLVCFCSGWPWFNRDCSSTWGGDSHFGYVHIHSRSMASNKQRYFRRSNTQTCKRKTGGRGTHEDCSLQ